ncbi:MAG: thioredoxin family protein [Melioribacteraceae bacterium]
MVSVKILGLGCKKCRNLMRKVQDIAAQNNIEAQVIKVTEIEEIVSSGIMMTPGLVINENVKSYGIIPKDEQILNWLKGN